MNNQDESEKKRIKELSEKINNKDIEMTEQDRLLEKQSSSQAKYSLKGWLTSVLRRASFRWGPRSTALKLARVERGLYLCNMCKGHFKQKDIKLDHIIPVVSIKDGFKFRDNGLPDWNDFIDRLFCDVEGFQVLCNSCHDAKTMMEDSLRAQFNKNRKLKEKEEKQNARKAKRTNSKIE